MKIGVISDTHIPLAAKALPPAILEEFKKVDLVLHAGDLLSLKVLDDIRAVCPQVKAVRGNMDQQEVRDKLPEKEIFTAGDFKIILTHGWGPPANLIAQLDSAFKKEAPDIIVFGHSHAPVNQTLDGILFFNPGSPTDKVFSPYNSYGIIEIGDKIESRIIKL